jgi:hypothetical protein
VKNFLLGYGSTSQISLPGQSSGDFYREKGAKMKKTLSTLVFAFLLASSFSLAFKTNSATSLTTPINRAWLENTHGYWYSTNEDVVANVPMQRTCQWLFLIGNMQDGTGLPIVNPNMTVLTDRSFVSMWPLPTRQFPGEYEWSFHLELPENLMLPLGAAEANHIDYQRPGFSAERHVTPETLSGSVTIQNLSITFTQEDPLPADINTFWIFIGLPRVIFMQKQLVDYTVLSLSTAEGWTTNSDGWQINPSDLTIGKTYHFSAMLQAVKSPELGGSPTAKPAIQILCAHWENYDAMTGSSANATHPHGPTLIVSAEGDYEWTRFATYSRQDFWLNQVVSDIVENPSPPPPYVAKIPATVDIKPEAYNMRRRANQVTAFIELPEGYNVKDINISTLLLAGVFTALPKPMKIGDYNKDGILDIMIKFKVATAHDSVDMTQLIERRFFNVTVKVTGRLDDGTLFQGSDTVKIIMPRW